MLGRGAVVTCFSLHPGKTLDLSFMTPGTLPSGVVFTRASTATYFDSTGTLQTAAMNIALQSADLSNAAWTKGGLTVAAPVVTGNNTAAPDGTTTAARIVYAAVPSGTNACIVYQQPTVTVAVYTFSIWLKGSVGGEVLYLHATPDSVTYYRQQCVLTTQWQRFTLTTGALTATGWIFGVGNDGRAGGPSTLAQTIYAWGAQVELGSTATTYAPTTTAPNGAPRWDYNPTTHVLNGLLIEEARTNMLLNSATLSTQSVTVPASVQALSFYGTGTITLSGVFVGTLVGTGPFPARTSLIFTPTAGVLTLTVTGSVLNAQLE